MTAVNDTTHIEQWGIFELALQGSDEGNPFLDVELTAQFTHKGQAIEVNGFYDGDGVYRIRFMPETQGTWRYSTHSNRKELSGAEGTFTCTPPTVGNHGPVHVADTFHFAYADGTPYKQIGTTCYAWVHQGDELEEQTLETLRNAPFNKMRLCVFPKHYAYNENEPEFYPFPCLSHGSSKWTGSWDGGENEGWSFDFSHFDPAFFRHFEQRIAELSALGIEADLILFHPYDCWGFARMDAETDDRYLRYVVARFAAYRNVWWSMANEYDLMRSKTLEDWDRFFHIVEENDPYQHLRSIHNCRAFYDHSKPWVTHASIQRHNLEQTREWREQYKKPVVVDECCYEGNIPHMWGNISGQEMVHRFWTGTVYGGYVGHGDTFLDPQDILWWAKGGVLHGQCAPRLAFLRRILEEGPATGLNPIDEMTSFLQFGHMGVGHAQDYYLVYFGPHQPAQMEMNVAPGERYTIEAIDPWEMTVTPLSEPATVEATKKVKVPLPGKPYLALRIRKIG